MAFLEASGQIGLHGRSRSWIRSSSKWGSERFPVDPSPVLQVTSFRKKVMGGFGTLQIVDSKNTGFPSNKYPLVNIQKAIENGHRNSGFSQLQNGGSFHSYVKLPEGMCYTFKVVEWIDISIDDGPGPSWRIKFLACLKLCIHQLASGRWRGWGGREAPFFGYPKAVLFSTEFQCGYFVLSVTPILGIHNCPYGSEI